MNEPPDLIAKIKNIDGKYVPSSGILKSATVVSNAATISVEGGVKEGVDITLIIH